MALRLEYIGILQFFYFYLLQNAVQVHHKYFINYGKEHSLIHLAIQHLMANGRGLDPVPELVDMLKNQGGMVSK